MSIKWVPKSVLALKNYSRQDFVADLIAGITVGLVALPLAMAFAIASGMPPQAGLYCAVIAGFLISALGGSRVQIGGPTGAFVVVVAGIVARYGVDGLFMCTGIAGVFLIFLGVTGLGSAVKYIPRPVVVGFTNGIAVVMLGAIESLMSAVVADKLFGHGEKHKPNVELIAQGVANFISPLMGGLPATGAIARTATNIRSGARTPVAGMIHALTLLAILMFATPVAKFIPLAVLAAILLVVSYNMGEWAEIPELLKLSRLEVACWSATFVLTVFADLTVAVEAGMILAALVFIRKVTATTTISRVTKEYLAESKLHVLQDKEIPPYATVFRIHGPFLFGAADKIDDLMQQIPDLPPIVILRLRNMTAIDATGIRALEELADRVKASGRRLILCGAREQPAQLMRQSEFEQHVGAENICANVTEALARAGVVFPQIAAEAPSVQKWGRRSTDHVSDEEEAAAKAVSSRD